MANGEDIGLGHFAKLDDLGAAPTKHFMQIAARVLYDTVQLQNPYPVYIAERDAQSLAELVLYLQENGVRTVQTFFHNITNRPRSSRDHASRIDAQNSPAVYVSGLVYDGKIIEVLQEIQVDDSRDFPDSLLKISGSKGPEKLIHGHFNEMQIYSSMLGSGKSPPRIECENLPLDRLVLFQCFSKNGVFSMEPVYE